MTLRMEENEIELDFMLIRIEHRRFMQDVNSDPYVCGSRYIYIYERKIERKTCVERRKILCVFTHTCVHTFRLQQHRLRLLI